MRDEWTDRLSEYVDGELTAAEASRLEAHLADCTACSDIVLQLGAVRDRGGSLSDREPPADLWPGIVERIRGMPVRDVPVVPIDAARRRQRRISLTVSQLAAAAVALVVVSGGSVWLAASSRQAELTATAELAGPPTSVADFATLDYETTVRDLEAVLREARDQLDPATRRALERSLATIDRAVRDAEEALARDPTNVYLSTHLAWSMKRKVEILRRALALANVTT